jgi:RimJ/RimL family protein N-acetyltransferase
MIVVGQRDLVAAWVASKIKDMREPPQKDFEAVGVARDGRLIGGVIYVEYREVAPGEHDIRMHCATLRAFFQYPFEQLRCCRVTGVVARANKRALDLNRRLGFKIEGCIRDGYGTGKDGLLMGMLKDECVWIR